MRKIAFITTIFFFLSVPLALWSQLGSVPLIEETIYQDPSDSEENITLNSVDLYWSADSYVPFGYQGRALPVKGSSIIVEVDLDITGGNSQNLKYSWFLDDVFQEAKSGYGQDRLQFYIRRGNHASHDVLVKIFNESRSFYLERSMSIPVTAPELVIYKRDNSEVNLPYFASAKSFKVQSEKEFSFSAIPYFFNINSVRDLEFEWSLGEKSVEESSLTANIFGLKIVNKEVEGTLKEKLKVSATNKQERDQRIQKVINIEIY